MDAELTLCSMYLFFAEFSTNPLACLIYGGLRWGGAVFTGFTVGYRNYEIYVNHAPGYSTWGRENPYFLGCYLLCVIRVGTSCPVSASLDLELGVERLCLLTHGTSNQ